MRTQAKGEKQTAEKDRVYRYWVEIQNLSDGTARVLELKGIAHVPLVDPKKHPEIKTKHTLLLEDDPEPIEAETFEDFRTQLRQLRAPLDREQGLRRIVNSDYGRA